MSTNLIQCIAAGIIVLLSALYAAWRLATPRVRLKLLERLGGASGHPWRARLRDALAPRASGGCHDCAAGPAKRRNGARG